MTPGPGGDSAGGQEVSRSENCSVWEGLGLAIVWMWWRDEADTGPGFHKSPPVSEPAAHQHARGF